MTYNTPRLSEVASVENKVQGHGTKSGSTCRDAGLTTSSTGAYEVDE